MKGEVYEVLDQLMTEAEMEQLVLEVINSPTSNDVSFNAAYDKLYELVLQSLRNRTDEPLCEMLPPLEEQEVAR